MKNIAITYFSGRGHTKKLAEAVSEGCGVEKDVNTRIVNVDPVGDIDWSILHEADAIVMGSPTYMGGCAGEFKMFLDKAGDFWLDRKWKDKIAAGFTIGTSVGGDKLSTLFQMSVFAAQQGMIWIGQDHVGSKQAKDDLGINESGCWLGLAVTSSPDKTIMIPDNDILTANMFGKRIAHSTLRWSL